MRTRDLASASTPRVEATTQTEMRARARLARELAELPPWTLPELWGGVRGERGPRLSLGVLAYLLAEARQREEAEAARELFTRMLARIERANQRWAAELARSTSGSPGVVTYAVREDLCQELALRLWQRLALDPSEAWQLFFWRALDFERQHVAEAYMRRNGHWVRAARSASLRRVPATLQQPWDETSEGADDERLARAELGDVRLFVLRLPERERTAVTLRFWAEANEAQIGAFLGVSPRTVRTILRRAYDRLRVLYAEKEEDA